MTIEQWRSNPSLGFELRNLMETTSLKWAMEILRETCPSKDAVSNQEGTDNSAFILGKVIGYRLCEERIRSLAEVRDKIDVLNATYGTATEE